jgi:DNA polymerase III epsilon subunit family exonuclease
MLDWPLVVVDVETTGLSPRYGDRVIEIGLVRAEGGVETTFGSLVNPCYPISPGAMAVHGITQAMVEWAPTFGELAGRIWPFLDGAIVVAHNAPFDLSFLNAERGELGLSPLQNKVIDTLALARRHFRFPRNSLGVIAETLAIPAPLQHRALADACTTLRVLGRFVAELRARGMAIPDALWRDLSAQWSSDPDGLTALPPPITEALAAKRRLQVRYVSAQQVETVREVEPLEVIPQGDYLYLRAFCHLRQDERTFRLDRIVEMITTGEGAR